MSSKKYTLNTSLQTIDVISQKQLQLLSEHNFVTIKDLLLYPPTGYSDLLTTNTIDNFQNGMVNTVITVLQHKQPYKSKKAPLIIIIADATAQAQLACFGRSNLRYVLKIDQQYRLYGKFEWYRGAIQASQFEFEAVQPPSTRTTSQQHKRISRFGRIVAEYSAMGEFTGKQFDAIMQNILPYVDFSHVPNTLDSVMQFVSVPLADALHQLHAPATLQQSANAKNALVRYELLALQHQFFRSLHHTSTTQEAQPASSAQQSSDIKQTMQQLQLIVDTLPFKLTADQQLLLDSMYRTFKHGYMKKLLQGDVGVGKTLVALLSILPIINQGHQVVFMVPTELLAHQQYRYAAKLFSAISLTITLLTGSLSSALRKQSLQDIRSGSTQLIIGTHALFSAGVVYHSLKYIIVDEQQRFGVEQRQRLQQKGGSVHQLFMTATPIPRSLALAIYGKFDIETIKTKPIGRLPVKTHLVKQSNEHKAYSKIIAQLERGHQAYFVYPFINQQHSSANSEYDATSLLAAESTVPSPHSSQTDAARAPTPNGGATPRQPSIYDSTDATSIRGARTMYDILQNGVFADFRLQTIYSQMKEQEKVDIMNRFVAGEIDVLLATSVIEVGVDVPNATCILIDHAERFGLSTLHQLRGRVGRSHLQSYAFLMYDDSMPLTAEALSRLSVLYTEHDGFYISQADLFIRGPGELTGSKQSGGIRYRFATFPHHLSLLKEALTVINTLNQPNTSAAEPFFSYLTSLFE